MRSLMSLVFLGGLLLAVWYSLDADEQARLKQAFAHQVNQAQPAVVPVIPAVQGIAVPALVEYRDTTMACVRREVTEAAAPRTTTGIYRWQDGQGHWHYTDQAPSQAQAVEDLSARFPAAVRHVDLILDMDPRWMPPARQLELQEDAERIFAFYLQYLPQAAQRHLQVTVHGFIDKPAFVDWQAARDSKSQANAGVYDSISREAAVMLEGDPEWDEGVIRHEISHAVQYELLARTPAWFDEGMAEFFRAVRLRDGRWQAASAWVRHVDRLASAGPGDIRRVLSQQDWPGADPALAYARAWGVTTFLWSDAADPALWGHYVQWLDQHYCQPVDSETYFADHYPGGLVALQRDWENWFHEQQQGRAQASVLALLPAR